MTLESEKREAINIAMQLGYPRKVVRKIQKAKSVYEVDRILTQARLDQE